MNPRHSMAAFYLSLTHFPCMRGQCDTHTRCPQYVFIHTGVGSEEKKQRIQERTCGSYRFTFTFSDHLLVPQRTARRSRILYNTSYSHNDANG